MNGILQAHLNLERDVRIALSQNKPVVIHNIPGDGGVWFTEGHVGMVAALDQTLQWQGDFNPVQNHAKQELKAQ